ncbi:Ion channel [Paraburkholderia ribeironis]|uniref:Ion channel n=1 Tax=Paraburkholderia ribeironis TaxID=1247936 RepID=A0A1N7RSM5_9BURK|nr:potassium channel family protein [Paraburkholderia ribeironis]SIT38110.1 Ion channel [Paraburkholderia ribeironis]
MLSVQPWRTRAAWLRTYNMSTLLALMMISVFVVPYATTSGSVTGRIARDILLTLVLLSGVIAASDRRRAMMWLAPIVLLAIVVRWAAWLSSLAPYLMIRDGATLLALGLLGMVVGVKVFGAGAVTLDRIRGAIVLYILVGVVWADVYEFISLQIPAAFSGIPKTAGPPDRSTWLYFSFVTLTTVGYGDIVPVARAARSLANLEALIGQLYPAIVLARLVSLQVAGGSSGKNSP